MAKNTAAANAANNPETASNKPKCDPREEAWDDAVAGIGRLSIVPSKKVDGNPHVEAYLVDGKPVTRVVNGVEMTVVRPAK